MEYTCSAPNCEEEAIYLCEVCKSQSLYCKDHSSEHKSITKNSGSKHRPTKLKRKLSNKDKKDIQNSIGPSLANIRYLQSKTLESYRTVVHEITNHCKKLLKIYSQLEQNILACYRKSCLSKKVHLYDTKFLKSSAKITEFLKSFLFLPGDQRASLASMNESFNSPNFASISTQIESSIQEAQRIGLVINIKIPLFQQYPDIVRQEISDVQIDRLSNTASAPLPGSSESLPNRGTSQNTIPVRRGETSREPPTSVFFRDMENLQLDPVGGCEVKRINQVIWLLIVKPSIRSRFKGVEFKFDISFDGVEDLYPSRPPSISLKQEFNHPNMRKGDLRSDLFRPNECRISDMIKRIVGLIENPE